MLDWTRGLLLSKIISYSIRSFSSGFYRLILMPRSTVECYILLVLEMLLAGSPKQQARMWNQKTIITEMCVLPWSAKLKHTCYNMLQPANDFLPWNPFTPIILLETKTTNWGSIPKRHCQAARNEVERIIATSYSTCGGRALLKGAEPWKTFGVSK